MGHVTIIPSFQKWEAATSTGWCNNPTIEDYPVGYCYQCTEEWNDHFENCSEAAIIVCAIPCMISRLGCATCFAANYFTCAYPNGICEFINKCTEGVSIYPVEADIVDPNGDKGGTCSVE